MVILVARVLGLSNISLLVDFFFFYSRRGLLTGMLKKIYRQDKVCKIRIKILKYIEINKIYGYPLLIKINNFFFLFAFKVFIPIRTLNNIGKNFIKNNRKKIYCTSELMIINEIQILMKSNLGQSFFLLLRIK